MKTKDDFAVFILTNGRPDKVITYNSLKSYGYSGRIYLLVDDLDKTKDAYVETYGDEVVVFDKCAIAKTFDQGDNFKDMRAIIYARNASFEVAKSLGLKYFVQLDDDYTHFNWRFDDKFEYTTKSCRSLDSVFECLLKFLKSTNVKSIALAQGGDFIGGSENKSTAFLPSLSRKCMNSFFCSVDNPFQFVGRINEDVNAYTRLASTGHIFFTLLAVSLTQKNTQSNSGGMTELYLDSGTYIKSFYTVMYHPSSVTIKLMESSNKRLHHSVKWKNTVPKILRESVK